MQQLNLNRLILVFASLAIILAGVFLFWWSRDVVVSKNDPSEDTRSSLAGIDCVNFKERPIAVMLAGDREARPLSGISQADIVFEMPVAPNGITRFMAVYQCDEPKEIGSVRSARGDFIPLAAGLNAIYAHWGGEHDALEKLNNKILDNVDALKYEGTIFYRKRKIKQPHNGFTNLRLLKEKARELNYNFEDKFEGYPRTDKINNRNLANLAASINVGYQEPFNSSWTFDSKDGLYKRERNGKPEVDIDNNVQVSASVVIIMETKSSFIRDQYIKVNVQGEGTARIYQGGSAVSGKWKKDPAKLGSKLYFIDSKGEEIKLLPGKIWIQIVTN